MKKADLIENVFSALDSGQFITKSKLKRVINSIFFYIQEHLMYNESIKIVNFGTFRKVKTKSRKGKNFRTGEQCYIPQRFTVKFKVSKRVTALQKLSLSKKTS